MAKTNTIEFKGHFDGNQILNELKKIRQSMLNTGADANLFKNVDKEVAATEKLITEMMAQVQKGFSNTKEINSFEKQVDKLQTNLLKISTGLKNINIADNFKNSSPEISKLVSNLEKMTSAQESLNEASKNSIKDFKRRMELNDKDLEQIEAAIDANENLEETLKRVGQAKERAAKAKYGKSGLKTDAGAEYIKSSTAGVTLEDLSATAMTGSVAKGKSDARRRRNNGSLYGSATNRELDNDKAMAAVNESYQKALTETIKNGGNAAEAVEEMRKVLAEYGVEIKNVDKLQQNFADSLDNFYKSGALNQGQKSKVSKNAKMGSTNAQGEYVLSQDTQDNFLGNNAIIAAAENQKQIETLTQEIANKQIEAQEKLQGGIEQTNHELSNQEELVGQLSKTTLDEAESTREAVESNEKLSDTFENMKGAIKTFLSIGSVVSSLKNIIRDTFTDITELDKSFAEIAMVTDYSVQDMWNSYDQYAEMANELGQSTKSVIQASGLFYQQGC